MNWYYRKSGTLHIRVRVFTKGAMAGELIFRKEEFDEIKKQALRAAPNSPIHSFYDDEDTLRDLSAI